MISKQKIISYQSINYPECRMIGDHGGDGSDCNEAICLTEESRIDCALLDRWTVDVRADLASELGAAISHTRWRHPSHYGMVKKALVEIGNVGTRACQSLWVMRRETYIQLDAYMATPQENILEHERTHLPRLPHACILKPSLYEKLMAETSGGGTGHEPVRAAAECHIMVYKLLQCHPNKVWAKNYLRTFSNRSGRRISWAGGSEDTDTASTGAIPQLTNGKGRMGRNQRSKG